MLTDKIINKIVFTGPRFHISYVLVTALGSTWGIHPGNKPFNHLSDYETW